MVDGVAGVILAGGRSARMGGGDKCLRLLAGKPILAHVEARLRRQVERVALNANGDAGRFSQFALPVIADPLPDMGPLGGVLAGLRWGREHACTHVVTAACDTPFFPTDLGTRLLQDTDTPYRIVQSRSGGRIHPTFALWPTFLADDLASFLREKGASSVRAYAGELHQPLIVDFAGESRDPFFNINTPDDLKTAERIMEAKR